MYFYWSFSDWRLGKHDSERVITTTYICTFLGWGGGCGLGGFYWSELSFVVLFCVSLHVLYTAYMWRCEQAKGILSGRLYAPYLYIVIHSSLTSLLADKYKGFCCIHIRVLSASYEPSYITLRQHDLSLAERINQIRTDWVIVCTFLLW